MEKGTSLIFIFSDCLPKKVCLNNLIKEATVPPHATMNTILSISEGNPWNNIFLLTNPLRGGIPDMDKEPTKQAKAVTFMDFNPPNLCKFLSPVA